MTRHANPFANSIVVAPPAGLDEEDCFTLDDPDEADAFEAEFDDSLDHLLKHALKSRAPERDTGHVWQRLSRRVQGPFGYTALEAPAFNSLEVELLTSGGTASQAPFVLNDRVTRRCNERALGRSRATDGLWDMLRFGASGRALGSSVG